MGRCVCMFCCQFCLHFSELGLYFGFIRLRFVGTVHFRVFELFGGFFEEFVFLEGDKSFSLVNWGDGEIFFLFLGE